MLLEKLTTEELDFMENFHDPICMAECLFSNFDDLGEFDEEILGKIRLYQLPFLSYESTIDEKVDGLTEKERFNLRKMVGDVINVGARKYGKTLITLRIDIVLSLIYDDRWACGFYSIDEKRLRGVLDHVKLACEYHPFIKNWNVKCSYKPDIKFISPKNRWVLQGINLTIKGQNPGEQFYQLHVQKLWGEEVSFETKQIYEKRKEAVSELGAITRLAGMTDFTKHSPIGQAFTDIENKTKIINLPQFVSPYWDEREKKDRIKAYGGEDTTNYRVFVKGEIVEDGISEFDMDRIRRCYKEKEEIKRFEIPKDRYDRFKDYIIVERPKNAGRIFIVSDVGDNQTEIIVLSEIGDKYNYLYRISLYGLIKDEQLEVFKYLIEKLEANVIAVDCGDALGRILADDFEKLYSKENVVRYMGASRIQVGFEKDQNDNVIIKKGEPVYRQEYMSEWAVRRLKVLLYGERIRLPMDYSFDLQFNAVISTKSGTRRLYKCVSEDNHLFDTFKVFAIAQWLKKDFNATPKIKQEWGIGASSWSKEKGE
jgi:hypothetical protein